MSFKDFKKATKDVSPEAISKELEAVSGGREKDERFWYPKMDENKRSYSLIRFLPARHPEKSPAVRTIQYWIDGPGGTYRESSPAAINLPDPVKEYSRRLYKEGQEEEAKKFWPRTYYIANILVIKDPGNPENENKVFLYRFGKSVFNMIQEKVKPQYANEEKVNVFDFWKGANFKLKTSEQGGFVNYDKSSFEEEPTPLYDGDDELIEQVYNQLYELQPFIAETNFKPYEELKALFHRVMGFDMEPGMEDHLSKSQGSRSSGKPAQRSAAPKKEDTTDFDSDTIPDWSKGNKAAAAKPAAQKAAAKPPKTEELETEDEDENLETETEEESLEETKAPSKAATKPAPAQATRTAIKPKAPAQSTEEEGEEQESAPAQKVAPKASSGKPGQKPTPAKKDDVIEEGEYNFFEE